MLLFPLYSSQYLVAAKKGKKIHMTAAKIRNRIHVKMSQGKEKLVPV
jgi:hypothetical protein